jgi:hypothetical protein
MRLRNEAPDRSLGAGRKGQIRASSSSAPSPIASLPGSGPSIPKNNRELQRWAILVKPRALTPREASGRAHKGLPYCTCKPGSSVAARHCSIHASIYPLWPARAKEIAVSALVENEAESAVPSPYSHTHSILRDGRRSMDQLKHVAILGPTLPWDACRTPPSGLYP